MGSLVLIGGVVAFGCVGVVLSLEVRGGIRSCTGGKNEGKIRKYIQNQLEEDEMSEQLTLNFEDPFTGNGK